MSEPFGLDDAGAPAPQNTNTPTKATRKVWDQAKSVWNAIWHQSLFVKRRGQTAIQLPLALAVVLAVLFPHAAALVLVIGIIAGYSFAVAPR